MRFVNRKIRRQILATDASNPVRQAPDKFPIFYTWPFSPECHTFSKRGVFENVIRKFPNDVPFCAFRISVSRNRKLVLFVLSGGHWDSDVYCFYYSQIEWLFFFLDCRYLRYVTQYIYIYIYSYFLLKEGNIMTMNTITIIILLLYTLQTLQCP